MSLKHSFPPVFDVGARILVLGSLPGDRSLAAQRYYAHPQNQFWHLMSPVVGSDLVVLDYDDRLAALRANGVALWDVIESARRAGSSDAALQQPAAHDRRRGKAACLEPAYRVRSRPDVIASRARRSTARKTPGSRSSYPADDRLYEAELCARVRAAEFLVPHPYGRRVVADARRPDRQAGLSWSVERRRSGDNYL